MPPTTPTSRRQFLQHSTAALAQSEMVYGRQIAVEETLANIDAVTVGDVAAIAHEFFTPEKVAFAAIGDLEGDAITRDDLRV